MKRKLTWQAGKGRPGRWRKVYKGKAYLFPGGRGPNDRAAYDAAVDAWDAKRREIDGEGPQPQVVADPPQVVADPPAWNWDDSVPDWRQAADALFRKTVENRVRVFLAEKRALVAAGQLSVERHYALGIQLGHFQVWLGPDEDVKSVDGGVLVRYHAHLLKQIAEGRWTTKTASHYFAGVKTWVNWLYDTEAIQSIPRGIKRLVIRRYAPPIKTFGLDQIKLLLSKASLRTRLYCLLALNCGLYQSDVATLRRDEVDLKAGTITRRRTKTRHLPNPPVVTYVLWTATKNALAEHMAADGDLALLGEGGLSLLRKEVTAEGKLKKTDAIKSAFDRLLLKTKLTGSYKLLRKTSASLLADSQWPDVVDLFLGHAAAKISDKHYAQAAQGRLRDALEWLRGRYGV